MSKKNNLNRLIILVVFLFSFIVLITLQSAAAADASEDYAYYVNDDGTATISAYMGDEEHVVVPDVIDGWPVSALEGTFWGNKTVRTVTVASGITTIGENTFAECPRLTYVHLLAPYSVDIYTSAFYGSEKLRLVNSETKNIYIDYPEDLYSAKYRIGSVGPIRAFVFRLPRIVRLFYTILLIAIPLLLGYLLMKWIVFDSKEYVKYRNEVFKSAGIENDSSAENRMTFYDNKLQRIRFILIRLGIIISCLAVYWDLIDGIKYKISVFLPISNPVLYDVIFVLLFCFIVPIIVVIILMAINQIIEKKRKLYSKSTLTLSKGSRYEK